MICLTIEAEACNWFPGAAVSLVAWFTDRDTGVSVDPAAITLSVRLPDGTNVAPTFEHMSTGHYEALFVMVQSGRHWYRWASTAPGENVARQGEFFVLTSHVTNA